MSHDSEAVEEAADEEDAAQIPLLLMQSVHETSDRCFLMSQKRHKERKQTRNTKYIKEA